MRRSVHVRPAGPPPVAAGYDLAAAIAAVPFAVNLPAEPVITSEATVTNVTELNASINIAGRRTTLAADTDFATGFTLTANDQEIVFLSGARLTPAGAEAMIVNGSRISVTGQRQEHCIGSVRLGDGTDLSFDGVDVDATRAVSDWADSNEAGAPTRVLILSCIWRAHRYSLIWGTATDVVIANSRHHGGINGGGQSTNRFAGGGARLVTVDSLYQNEGTHHRFRVHKTGANIYAARCHFDSGNGVWIAPSVSGDPHEGIIEDVWLYDNRFYNCSLILGHPPTYPASGVQRLRADGNEQYTVGGGGQFIAESDASWTIGSNLNMNTTTAVSWERQ